MDGTEAASAVPTAVPPLDGTSAISTTIGLTFPLCCCLCLSFLLFSFRFVSACLLVTVVGSWESLYPQSQQRWLSLSSMNGPRGSPVRSCRYRSHTTLSDFQSLCHSVVLCRVPYCCVVLVSGMPRFCSVAYGAVPLLCVLLCRKVKKRRAPRHFCCLCSECSIRNLWCWRCSCSPQNKAKQNKASRGKAGHDGCQSELCSSLGCSSI